MLPSLPVRACQCCALTPFIEEQEQEAGNKKPGEKKKSRSAGVEQ
jgi:hypothetical protein